MRPESLMNTAPSGSQYELRRGGFVVAITEVGAGLRSFTADGRQLIDGYLSNERCTGVRGHSLIPWPNRIKSGKYRWNDVDYQLDITEPSAGNAIHGLTRWASWNLVERDDEHAIFQYTLYPRDGWDWVYDCTIEYVLDDAGLTVRTSAMNLSDNAGPYGTGAHPYLTAGTQTIDSAHVTVPGSTYLAVDGTGIPTGNVPVEGTIYDLRSPTELGERKIDVAYTGLARDADGRAGVRLSAPNGDAVSLWSNEAYPFLQLYTGDTLPELGRRRAGLAVEPMTCAPDAFNSGNGLITLEPGEAHHAEWGIQPE